MDLDKRPLTRLLVFKTAVLFLPTAKGLAPEVDLPRLRSTTAKPKGCASQLHFLGSF